MSAFADFHATGVSRGAEQAQAYPTNPASPFSAFAHFHRTGRSIQSSYKSGKGGMLRLTPEQQHDLTVLLSAPAAVLDAAYEAAFTRQGNQLGFTPDGCMTYDRYALKADIFRQLGL